MEADLHRQVVQDSIDYLWNRSAFPGQSLDDVYARPTVAFAARNNALSHKKWCCEFTRRDAAVVTIAIFGFASMFLVYKQKEKSAKVLFQEETVELDVKKARKSKVNIFKKKTDKEKAAEEERKNLGEPLL